MCRIVPFPLALSALLLAAAPPASAQVAQWPAPAALPERPTAERAAALPVPLDRAVDAREYRLGPGDVLALSAGGISDWNQTLTVSPEGTVRVPNLGVVRVAGVTLADVRDDLARRLKPYFPRAPVDVVLSRPRSFRVAVAGDVAHPGPVTLAGPSRVWDALDAAGGFPPQVRRLVSLRRGGREVRLDLMAFQRLGDLDQNPYLDDGDVVVLAPMRRAVEVHGGVNAPGQFEFADGDRLGRLAQLAGGFLASADTTRVRVLRFRGPMDPETLSVGAAVAGTGDASVFPLQDGDRVFVDVRPHYHEAFTVDVAGAVPRPGGYPIEDGRTRFSQVLALAGGLEAQADSDRVTLLRPTENPPQDTAYGSWLLRSQELRGFEREYAKMRARTRAQISLDLKAALAAPGSADDPPLRAGDVVLVPRRATSVLVQGEVVRPGLVRFLGGGDPQRYVEAAGGFTESADSRHVWVTLAATQQMVPADNAPDLRPGDVVWVPAKDRPSFWSVGKDLLTVMAQLATVLLVIREATRSSSSTTP